MRVFRGSAKTILFGSVAGLMAASGAQAADMPAKAKPVQYVKICTLYGDGFYYIPGSDTCIKFGGYIRNDYGFNTAGGRNPAYGGTQGAQDRTVAQFSTRHRANIGVDTRTQTQYGVLRTLTSVHIQNQDQSESFNVARAFIQWAGFTFGRSKSYSDTWSLESDWHYATQQNQSDTGANGANQFAYSFDLGNGTVVSIGADERRTKSIANLSSAAALKVGAEPVNSYTGERFPDPHVDLHIDQAWGFWALSLLAHDVSATYYTSTGPTGACPNGTVALTTCGHPGDRIGWVIMQGGEFKLPMLGPGDRIGYFFHYGQGTAAYSGGSVLTSADLFGSGNNVAVGWISDGVYINGSKIELTTAYSVAAGYEHYWTPTVSTSIMGGYTTISYDSTAKGYFATNVCPTAAAGGQTGFNTVIGNCNPDWHYFQGGVRLQWLPDPGWRLGVEGVFTEVFSAFNGSTVNLAGAPIVGARPAGIYSIGNQGIWSAVFRAQRNFNAGIQ